MMLLTAAGKSPLLAALYWLNPLILKELFNSAHMDGIAVAAVLLTLVLTLKKRPHWAAAALALAAGAKLWPILLAPLILQAAAPDRKTAMSALALFTALTGILLAPLLSTFLAEASGLTAYATTWKTNSALYPALERGADALIKTLSLTHVSPPLLTRIVIALTLAGLSIAIARRKIENSQDLITRTAVVIGAMLLLSPAQYPWYYVHFAPFLAFGLSTGMLLLTATLPLYYMRFHFIAIEQISIYQDGIVWLIWLPAWIMIAYELIKKKKG
jgi:hypothetical protein